MRDMLGLSIAVLAPLIIAPLASYKSLLLAHRLTLANAKLKELSETDSLTGPPVVSIQQNHQQPSNASRPSQNQTRTFTFDPLESAPPRPWNLSDTFTYIPRRHYMTSPTSELPSTYTEPTVRRIKQHMQNVISISGVKTSFVRACINILRPLTYEHGRGHISKQMRAHTVTTSLQTYICKANPITHTRAR